MTLVLILLAWTQDYTTVDYSWIDTKKATLTNLLYICHNFLKLYMVNNHVVIVYE